MSAEQTIFFRAVLQPNGTLSLIQDVDGTLRILRDGKQLEDYWWRKDQMREAVTEFTALTRALPMSVTGK